MANGCEPLQMGGYQYDYVEDPPDQLACPVCLLPCRVPHILDCCGRKFCQTCIERVQYANGPCPICRAKEFRTLIDRQHERDVLGLKIYCEYKENGCEWTGEIRGLKRHLEQCGYVTIRCRYNCGYECLRKDMEYHEEEECNERPLELKLVKRIEILERKLEEVMGEVGQLRRHCADQEGVLREQKEALDRHQGIIDEQKQEIEELRREREADKDEMEGIIRLANERYDEHNVNIKETSDQLLKMINEEKAAVNERLDATDEHLEDLKERAEKEKQEQYYHVNAGLADVNLQLGDHQTLIDNLVGKSVEEINRLDAQVKDLHNILTKEMEGSNQQLVTCKQELMGEINKARETNGAAQKQMFDQLEKASNSYKFPQWQKPFPLSLFSTVPPCQFIMTRFNYHKVEGKAWYSPPFYSYPGGYKLCLRIDPNGMLDGRESHLSVWVYIMKGEFDDFLKWPFTGKVTVQLLNWLSDRGHIQNIVTFDDGAGDKVRSRVTNGKYAATGRGSSKFLSHASLPMNRDRRTQFCVDDCLCFRVSKVELNY